MELEGKTASTSIPVILKLFDASHPPAIQAPQNYFLKQSRRAMFGEGPQEVTERVRTDPGALTALVKC